jgi:tetratricopeptide (TPR) repeat protein
VTAVTNLCFPFRATLLKARGEEMKHTGLLVLLLFVMTTFAAAEPKTVADYLDLAHQKETADDYAGAIAIYDAILEQFPKDFVTVYASRAEDLAEIKEYKKAIADYTTALDLDTSENSKELVLDHGVVLKMRGEAKQYSGDREGAVADFTQALALNPGDTELFSDRADNRLRIGDCAGAISDYSSALEAMPEIIYYEGRAIGRICTGDLQSASADYHIALQKSNESDAEVNQHVVHDADLSAWALGVRLGHKDAADAQLSARLTAATAPSDIDQEYDAARYFLGQVGESVLFQDATTLKTKQPQYAGTYESDAYYFAGLKQLANGNKSEALKDFQKVLEYRQHSITVPELTHAWIEELNRHPK